MVGCSNRTFGQDCNNICGHCLYNEVCHHVNGTCLRGCNPGYLGDLCATRKKITLHNTNVHEGLIFSHWKTENKCVVVLFVYLLNLLFYSYALVHKPNIVILSSTWKFKINWFSMSFNILACSNRTYGYDCIETCGHCRNGADCHVVNGLCLTGCSPGYIEDLCKTRKCIRRLTLNE